MTKSEEKIRIIHAPSDQEPFVVLEKARGLPTAPLSPGDESALCEAEKIFPQIRLVAGKKEIEHGLVHRIDTETAGLVLIAATQEFFDFVSAAQKDGEFKKWYRAHVDVVPDIGKRLSGFPTFAPLEKSQSICVKSRFRYFGSKNQEVRPVTESSGKAALKKCESKVYETKIDFDADQKKAVCQIASGFRHQVRSHLAMCGIPVRGDRLYNPNFREGERLCFEAFRLEFPRMGGGQFVFEIEGSGIAE